MSRYLAINEFYHLFDRGVEKRQIFMDKNDYFRFIHDLYEFNDVKPALQFGNVGRATSNTSSNIASNIEERNRDLLVNVHAFVLMPNHHHLLAEQLKDDGITLFMKKLHGGYARGFNEKHKRNGYLFQGRFKDVHVSRDKQLAHLVCYIHSNPLKIWKKNWKEKQLTKPEIKEALKFLEKYRWSSHLDYLGIKNFPSIINKEFLLEFFNGTEGYKKFFIDWLEQYEKNVDSIRKLVLE